MLPPGCSQDETEAREAALQRLNAALILDNDKLNQLKTTLNNRFQALQDLLKEEGTTIEGDCKRIKEALTSTCQEVLNLKKHHHEEWPSIKTVEKAPSVLVRPTVEESVLPFEMLSQGHEYTATAREFQLTTFSWQGVLFTKLGTQKANFRRFNPVCRH
ncbi:unnamed protein product [Schistosoma mattheei]|uniref:Uncharacterized protein n=1 Tax=Schistosoma mattheei TaxID=31246 RepID=A0A183P5N7_9TREM|nr:unnamed protein product [Schistosoma mattheei]